jgi:hypothetical protein
MSKTAFNDQTQDEAYPCHGASCNEQRLEEVGTNVRDEGNPAIL